MVVCLCSKFVYTLMVSQLQKTEINALQSTEDNICIMYPHVCIILVTKYTTTANSICSNLNKLLYDYSARYVHNNEIKTPQFTHAYKSIFSELCSSTIQVRKKSTERQSAAFLTANNSDGGAYMPFGH